MPRETTEAGVYWLSNLLESDGLADSGEALQNLNRDETAAEWVVFYIIHRID